GQRLSTAEALLLFNLLRQLRFKGYSTKRILKSKLPKIEDVGFNSIFIRANTHLKHIAKTIGHELPEGLLKNIALSESALQDLWEPSHQLYFSFNVNTGEKV